MPAHLCMPLCGCLVASYSVDSMAVSASRTAPYAYHKRIAGGKSNMCGGLG